MLKAGSRRHRATSLRVKSRSRVARDMPVKTGCIPQRFALGQAF
jgi:hypothetical protein